jgi:hypothetical protein
MMRYLFIVSCEVIKYGLSDLSDVGIVDGLGRHSVIYLRFQAERIPGQAKSDDLPSSIKRVSAGPYCSAHDHIKIFYWIALTVNLSAIGDREAPADLVKGPVALGVAPSN